MAKPIIENPTIKGRAAKEFAKQFLTKSESSSKEKTQQHRKDIEVFLSNKVR